MPTPNSIALLPPPTVLNTASAALTEESAAAAPAFATFLASVLVPEAAVTATSNKAGEPPAMPDHGPVSLPALSEVNVRRTAAAPEPKPASLPAGPPAGQTVPVDAAEPVAAKPVRPDPPPKSVPKGQWAIQCSAPDRAAPAEPPDRKARSAPPPEIQEIPASPQPAVAVLPSAEPSHAEPPVTQPVAAAPAGDQHSRGKVPHADDRQDTPKRTGSPPPAVSVTVPTPDVSPAAPTVPLLIPMGPIAAGPAKPTADRMSDPVSDPAPARVPEPDAPPPIQPHAVADPPSPEPTRHASVQTPDSPPPQAPAIPPATAPADMKPVAAAAPQPPAERLAPVLVSIVNAPTGAQHMTLRLQPEALGQLQIQIDHVPDAPIQIRIEAERPQTLALLQRDTPQLQRALDQAGIQRDTMTLSFHAAPAVAAVPLAQDAGQTSQQFMGTGQPYQGFGEGRPHHAPFAWVEANDGPTSPADSVAQPHALRTGPTGSGIDITA